MSPNQVTDEGKKSVHGEGIGLFRTFHQLLQFQIDCLNITLIMAAMKLHAKKRERSIHQSLKQFIH